MSENSIGGKKLGIINSNGAYFVTSIALDDSALEGCELVEIEQEADIQVFYERAAIANKLDVEEVLCNEFVICTSFDPSHFALHDPRGIGTTIHLDDGETLESFIAKFEL